MIAYIDAHRDQFGVELICRVLRAAIPRVEQRLGGPRIPDPAAKAVVAHRYPIFQARVLDVLFGSSGSIARSLLSRSISPVNRPPILSAAAW